MSSIYKRFRAHCRDMKKPQCAKRPLYNAMRKYGIEHFHVELLEETNEPSIREQYWIQQYNSYQNGYNATLGGDGKAYINRQKVIELYQHMHNQKAVAQALHLDESTVRNILHSHHVPIVKSYTRMKPVIQIQNGCIIQQFKSATIAARHIIQNGQSSAKLNTITSRITDCARHERKSAYGCQWEFAS